MPLVVVDGYHPFMLPATDSTGMNRPLVAVVLAGGVGTRLFPASRPDRPKQFCTFTGDRSLLTRTVERVAFADESYVLTREAYADEVHDHAPSAGVLVEPEPKDTGPALVYAAHRVREQVDDAVLLCVPSDHHVTGDFADSARRAAAAAVETGGLVTLGVEPSRPATEYGYLEPGADHGDYLAVERFHEKPDTETAIPYREHGYLWNAGIFAWTPTAILSAARDSVLEPLVSALDDGNPERGFAAVDPVSIDYAVLEDAEDTYVVPADFEWDDLGSWDAFERVVDDAPPDATPDATPDVTPDVTPDATTDANGNVLLGDALAVDAEDCVIATGTGSSPNEPADAANEDPPGRAETGGTPHVSVVGVEDLVVAAYGDRVLVVPKQSAQRVREVVEHLRDRGLYGSSSRE